MTEHDVPDGAARERDEIVSEVEAEQQRIRENLDPAAQDPSTRRGITGATRRVAAIAGVAGGVVVGVVSALIWENAGIAIAAAVCAAIVCAILSAMLLLEREDGRVEEGVREGKEHPPT